MNFRQAKAMYVHRFTMEHIPIWSHKSLPNGKYNAPQYKTDVEWFANTLFPPNNPYAESKRDKSCHSSNQSFPLGMFLNVPYKGDNQ